jgi:hypothetical protein
MELTLNMSYEQVVNLIRQLPANQIAKITKEFSESYVTKKAKTEVSDFQKFILAGPTMSDEQYSNFKQQRQHFNTWRIQ